MVLLDAACRCAHAVTAQAIKARQRRSCCTWQTSAANEARWNRVSRLSAFPDPQTGAILPSVIENCGARCYFTPAPKPSSNEGCGPAETSAVRLGPQ